MDNEPGNRQFLVTHGAVLLRAGRHEEALAMLEKAREYLTAAEEAAERELAGSPPWNRTLTLKLLRDEASQKIGSVDEQSPRSDLPQRPPAPALPVRAEDVSVRFLTDVIRLAGL